MSPRQQLGALLCELDPSEQRLMDGRRGSTPVPGATVTLWRLPGRWAIWSAGPTTGTWWLTAADDDAEQTISHVELRPDEARPDITAVWTTPRTRAVAATTRAIRPGGWDAPLRRSGGQP